MPISAPDPGAKTPGPGIVYVVSADTGLLPLVEPLRLAQEKPNNKNNKPPSARMGKSKRRRGKAWEAYFIPPPRLRGSSSDVILKPFTNFNKPGFLPVPKTWADKARNPSEYYHIVLRPVKPT
jgi:hypothetical protein